MSERKPIPVVLDTDIGGDIDDAWALALLLHCPEVEVKLVLSACSDTIYRARIIAKLLEAAGRTDIPVGIGLPTLVKGDWRTVVDYVRDYNLADYPGTIHTNGLEALIELIDQSPEPVTIINIAGLSNIGALLKRRPDLAARIHFVGMHGSIYHGLEWDPVPIAECNVKADLAASQAVFAAPWKSMVITPLDTCGVVRLDGENYRRLFESPQPLLRDIFTQYRMWHTALQAPWKFEEKSSILFDTVAIFLAFSRQFLKFETLGIRVTDAGFTVPDENAGNRIEVAVDWLDLSGFQNFITERLLRQ